MSKRKPEKVVFLRADGNSKIGFGHIMRSAALAELLIDEGFRCVLVYKEVGGLPLELFTGEIEVLAISPQISLMDEPLWLKDHLEGRGIVVLDGYQFDSEYQRRIKDVDRFSLVAIDDLNEGYFHADLIINHSGEFKTSDYSAGEETKILLGPDFAILRKPFLEFARRTSNGPSNRNGCFIAFGGADPECLTEKAITAGIEMGFETINVILPSRLQISEIENTAGACTIKCFRNISGHQVLELMINSLIGICSSSTLAYEACCARLPLVTGYYVDNQIGIDNTLKKEGCCISLGDFRQTKIEDIKNGVKSADLETIKNSQARVFHGNSGKNLAKAFLELFSIYP